MSSMCMMSCYDLIKGEDHMQNCTASYWSVFISPSGSHDHGLLIDSDWSGLVT